MSNLVQRLTGDLSDIESGDKIAIHAFIGALNEYSKGKVTGQDVIDAFSLTTEQTDQAIVLRDLINAAPLRAEFMRTFKDLMYMGEVGVHPQYRDIVFINGRLEDEVTDQGGTLP